MVAPTIERAVSTWSLHRTLGRFAAAGSAVDGGSFLPAPECAPRQALIDLLPELAEHGYATLQICHFHLESRDPGYLARMRDSLQVNGIALEMLLIDDGDLTAEDVDEQLAWYDHWLAVAELLGAKRARICAGRSAPTAKRLKRSGELLAMLARRHTGVRIVTENWLELTPDAVAVHAVLSAAGDDVGLLIDLGNWRGSGKYAELASIAPRAESCHAKCHFTAEGPDEDDFRRSLEILHGARFAGPVALIYDGPDADEWTGLRREWQIVSSIW